MNKSNSIVVEILVSSEIPLDKRRDFENSLVEFLLSPDHLRPELASIVQKRGVELKQLSNLSTMPRLGVCPVPGALEFVPGPELTKIANKQGLSFTKGGTLKFEFNYAPPSKVPSDSLHLNIRVPEALAAHLTQEGRGEIVTALFGNCELPQSARDYLAAHGIDVDDLIQTEWKHAKSIPATTRVTPDTAARLKEHGFNPEQHGQIRVMSVSAL